jgi:hypothetical protein
MKQTVIILKADDSKAEMLELESNADGQPSFEDVYPLINTNIIEIAQGRWIQGGNKPEGVNVELYCDEEALMKADPQINHRASHLRYNLFKQQYGGNMPDPRLAGDVAVVFPAHLKIDMISNPDPVTGEIAPEDAEIFAAADKVASSID